MSRFRNASRMTFYTLIGACALFLSGCGIPDASGPEEDEASEREEQRILTPTRTTRPTWTPRPTSTVPDTPTFTPSVTPLPPDLARLQELTADWTYRGYMMLGADRWARLSLGPGDGQETVAQEGEVVNDVTVGRIYSWKVELHYEGAVREIEVTPDQLKPTAALEPVPVEPPSETRTDIPEPEEEPNSQGRDGDRIPEQETDFY